MLATVNNLQHHRHLELQLRHANEHTLGKRLRQLANLAKTASKAVVGDVGDWAQTVVDVRNALTHPDDDPDRMVQPTGTDLLLLSESIYTIIVLATLREVGLSEEALLAAANNSHVQWTAGQLTELYAPGWPRPTLTDVRFALRSVDHGHVPLVGP